MATGSFQVLTDEKVITIKKQFTITNKTYETNYPILSLCFRKNLVVEVR